MTDTRNLIERMENLMAALDEAQIVIDESFPNGIYQIGDRIDDARGIAGEILTMIDGR